MSPEIFKNKPYSYKSDVWALGCVLYEMTTLSHAFDANSLNGLATKIVKGKYPPIHAKYSRFLRELIGQMLLLNPQQRPDLDQILRKPFIKKHIINFFTDIASRPSQSIGEGTMIVRAAAGAAVNGNVGSDSNMISLRQQLHALDMTSAVADALGPKAAPADDVEAIKLAKEQASALKREQEHKQMVEAALEKLRKERESRAKERQSVEQRGYARPTGFPRSNAYAGRNRQQYAHGHRPSGHSPAPAPVEVVKKDAAVGVRDRGMNWNKKNDDDNSSVNSKGRDRSSNRDPSPADAPRRRSSFGDDNKSRAMAERERRALEENRRLQQEQEAREVRIREDRKREEVRAEARARELAKLKEEAQRKEEISAQKKIQELRQQADVASRRDAQRERERERQRNEIEQLKRDKLELDKRAHERDRLREQRRAEERNRLEEASKISPDGDEKGLPVKKEYSPRAPRIVAEDKHEELSARERVVLRKQEKAQKEEADRLEALRVAENENRRIRVAAQYQLRNQYQGDPVLPGVIPKRQSQDEQKVNYEFEPRKQRNPMNMEELSDRLEDATKGKATK